MTRLAVGIVCAVLAAGVAVYLPVQEDETAAMGSAGGAPAESRLTDSAPTPPFEAPSPAPLIPPEIVPKPSLTAIPGRPEFDVMFRERLGVAEIHARFEEESRDQTWASVIEDRFNRAFSANSELQPHSPSVECRTTRCEVRLLAHESSEKAPEEGITLLNRGVYTTTSGQAPLPKLDMVLLNAMEVDRAAVVLISLKFRRDGSVNPGP